MATALQNRNVSDADRVATLVRIYRSAILSGDRELAEIARTELLSFGIRIGEAK